MEQNPRISEKLHVRIPGKEEDKRVRKNFAYIEKSKLVSTRRRRRQSRRRHYRQNSSKSRQHRRRQSRRQDRRQNSSESRQRPPTRTVQIWTKKYTNKNESVY